MAKLTCAKFDSGKLVEQLADMKGAVHLAIEGILSADPDHISAAAGTLCMVERELQRLQFEIEAVDDTKARNRWARSLQSSAVAVEDTQ